MNTVWVGKKFLPGEPVPEKEDTYYGAPHITEPRVHPAGEDPEVCVFTGAGAWNDKIYHFLPDKPPSSNGDEIQSEYFVKYSDFIPAMNALYAIKDKFIDIVRVNEIRMAKADSIFMSPCRGTEDFIGIHFTWRKDIDRIISILPVVEATLAQFNVKPHPGKIFELSGDRYEKLYGKELVQFREIV